MPDLNPKTQVSSHVPEIMAQTSLLLWSNLPGGPFQGSKVRRELLGGCSKQVMFVHPYMSDAHQLYRTADGRSIFGGHFPACICDCCYWEGRGYPWYAGDRSDERTPSSSTARHECAGQG